MFFNVLQCSNFNTTICLSVNAGAYYHAHHHLNLIFGINIFWDLGQIIAFTEIVAVSALCKLWSYSKFLPTAVDSRVILSLYTETFWQLQLGQKSPQSRAKIRTKNHIHPRDKKSLGNWLIQLTHRPFDYHSRKDQSTNTAQQVTTSYSTPWLYNNGMTVHFIIIQMKLVWPFSVSGVYI